ncbi:MAG: PEP-CTERM sorting domain-containing protein [Betaproteobacteria bacterium]|nr:PEP-CTERM sorting domain-containing protein [Betaproteobacteria bacterium]
MDPGRSGKRLHQPGRRDSSAFLWAKITAVEPVSEPASLALLAASLGMAGWFVRKSKAA